MIGITTACGMDWVSYHALIIRVGEVISSSQKRVTIAFESSGRAEGRRGEQTVNLKGG